MKIPFKIDLTKPPCWRDHASNVEVWDAWDSAWRKRLGWRAGLTFWGKTNTPKSRILLSRHWPHRLCWSWSIWVGLARPGFDRKCFSFVVSRRWRMTDIRLWWFKFSFNTQDSDWMAGLGPYRQDAPKIYWKHHLQHAEPAGTA